MKPKRKRQDYPKEFRDDAVKLVIKKVTIVPRLAGVLESIIQTFHAGLGNIEIYRKTPQQADFLQARLKPKTVVCAKRINGC